MRPDLWTICLRENQGTSKIEKMGQLSALAAALTLDRKLRFFHQRLAGLFVIEVNLQHLQYLAMSFKCYTNMLVGDSWAAFSLLGQCQSSQRRTIYQVLEWHLGWRSALKMAFLSFVMSLTC